MDEKSTWEKSSDKLVALFEELAPREPGVTVKKMFGWPCCFVNGTCSLPPQTEHDFSAGRYRPGGLS
jgi:hypothetical protein